MESINVTRSGGAHSLHQSQIVKKVENTNSATAVQHGSPSASISISEIHQAQEEAISELQKAMEAIQGPQKTLQISVHDKTQAIVIKVLNKETGDLIREVPSEKLLDIVSNMMEVAGIIIDKRV